MQCFPTFDAAVEHCETLIEELHELDFEVDGLVLKVNRFDQRERLGATSKSPRWLVAYKFEKYEATTRVNDIRVQVGKTGAITPMADLEPVQLAGTTVSRASLHNAEEIERKDVRVGDTVVVEKAGKIIPHVVRVEKHLRPEGAKEFPFPTKCPECGTKLVKDEGGVYIRCPNLSCPAQLRERIRLLCQPLRDGHRGTGRQAGRATGVERVGEDVCRSVSIDGGASSRNWSGWGEVGGEAGGQHRGEQVARTGAVAQCAVDPACGQSSGGDAGRITLARWRSLRRRAWKSWRRWKRWAK